MWKFLKEIVKAADFTIHLDADAFAHYDTVSHGWTTDPGTYTIEVGASSADIRLKVDVSR